jgi:hypothetical protein
LARLQYKSGNQTLVDKVETKRVASDPNVWQHVICTVDKNGAARMFINGSLVAATQFRGGIPAFTASAAAISAAGAGLTGDEHNGDIARIR